MDKKIVLFGIGKIGKEYLLQYKKEGLVISYICDNNEALWGTEFAGIEIVSPERLLCSKEDIVVIITTIDYFAEIKKMLIGNNRLHIYSVAEFEYLKTVDRVYNEKCRCVESKLDKDNLNAQISFVIDVHSDNDTYLQNCMSAIMNESASYEYEIKRLTETVVVNGQVVIVVNDTTIMQSGAVDALYRLWERNKECLIGSVVANEYGEILSAGYYLKENCLVALGYGSVIGTCEYSYMREVPCVAETGMLMPAELFDEWKKEYYAESCIENAQSKFALLSKTAMKTKTLIQPLAKMIDYDNKKYFNKKVIKDLITEIYEDSDVKIADGLDIFFNNESQIALFADSEILQYDTNAGAKSSFDYLNAILNNGWKVIYYPLDLKYNRKYAEVLQNKGVLVLYDVMRKQEYMEFLTENIHHIKYAFINRPNVANRLRVILEKNNNLYVSYYGLDVHHLRISRQYEVEQNPQLLLQAEKYKSLEVDITEYADCAGYPSYHEVAYMSDLCPNANVMYYPIYSFKNHPLYKRTCDNKGILFVGGFRHAPNVDGVIWFVNEILPLLRKQGITDSVYLVGAYPTEEVCSLQKEDVIVTGFVEDEELRRLYETCKIAILPLRFGAGMKGKLLEALNYGIPVVTTSIGAEGLMDDDGIFGLADQSEAFAEEIVKIYKDFDLSVNYSIKGQEYIQKHFGENVINELIKKQLDEATNFKEGCKLLL